MRKQNLGTLTCGWFTKVNRQALYAPVDIRENISPQTRDRNLRPLDQGRRFPMSCEKPIEILSAARRQIRALGGPEAEPWPHGSICKYDNGDMCLTLGVPAEQFRRTLTLRFGVALEVSLQGDEYRVVCQQQVVNAILSFWDGIASESSRVVQIQVPSSLPSSQSSPMNLLAEACD